MWVLLSWTDIVVVLLKTEHFVTFSGKSHRVDQEWMRVKSSCSWEDPGVVLMNFTSSANMKHLLSRPTGKSLMYIMNKRGPKTVP